MKRWILAGVAMLATAVVGGGEALAQGGFHARGPFDGGWAIDVRTASGPCGTGFAGEYSITEGRIAGRFTSGSGVREVTGSVSPEGSFEMRIGGADGIVLTGQLRWRVGWGEWESAGCSGSFMTNRR